MLFVFSFWYPYTLDVERFKDVLEVPKPLLVYLFIFREKGRDDERERNIDVQEIHQLAASHTPPTRNLAYNPGMCPNQVSHWPPFSSQAGAQSTEPHQPRWILVILIGS